MTLPSDIANLSCWYKGGTGMYDATSGGHPVTTDGAAIKRWEDQSGNANHATQSTTNNCFLYDAVQDLAVSPVGGASSTIGMVVPSGVSLSNRACTFFLILEGVTLRQTYTGNLAITTMGLYAGASSNLSVYYHRGGVPIMYDGATEKTFSDVYLPMGSRTYLALVCSTTGRQWYVNGVAVGSSQAAAVAGTSNGGNLGFLNTANTMSAGFRDVAIYARALSSTEIASLQLYSQSRGVPQAYDANIYVDGDSNGIGLAATLNRGWWQRLVIPSATRVICGCEASMGIATGSSPSLSSSAATMRDPYLLAGVPNVLIVFNPGENDLLHGGSTPAQVYANLQTYCTAAKLAGWSKIILTTILSTSFYPSQADRDTYNALIRAGVSGGTIAADALADLAGNATIGATLAYQNATYYTDPHLTSAGHAIAAGLVQTELNPFLSAPDVGLSFSSFTVTAKYSATLTTGQKFTGTLTLNND